MPKHAPAGKTLLGKVQGAGRKGTLPELLKRHIAPGGQLSFVDQPRIRNKVMSMASKGTPAKRVEIDVHPAPGIEHIGFMDEVKGHGKVVVVELHALKPDYRKSAQILNLEGHTIGWAARDKINTAERWEAWKKKHLEK